MWVFSIIGLNKNGRRKKKRLKEPSHQNNWKALVFLECRGVLEKTHF